MQIKSALQLIGLYGIKPLFSLPPRPALLIILLAPVILLFSLVIPVGAEPNAYFTADGYRVKHYRSPTPESLPGGTVLFFSDELEELITQTRPLLINVLPLQRRAKSKILPAAWLMTKQYQQIPESIWLPNVGYARLDEDYQDYFKRHLSRYRHNDNHSDAFQRSLVFYCVSDCWLAWNAAKRAIEWGYTSVYWYRDGIDGWSADGHGLVPAQPLPMN